MFSKFREKLFLTVFITSCFWNMLVFSQYFTCEQKYVLSLSELPVLWKYVLENTDTLCSSYHEVRIKFSSFVILTLFVPIPQNGDTHSKNSSAICRQIVWVCLTILWGWRIKGYSLSNPPSLLIKLFIYKKIL